MPESLSEKTRINVPIITLLAILTGFGSAIGAAWGLREQMRVDYRIAIKEAVQEERVRVTEKFGHYITREEFAEWRRADAEKRDAQYYSLLNALERLRTDVRRR